MLSSYANTSLCLVKWIKTTPKLLQQRVPNSVRNLRDAVMTAKGTSKIQTGLPMLFYCRAKTRFMKTKHTKELLCSEPGAMVRFPKKRKSFFIPSNTELRKKSHLTWVIFSFRHEFSLSLLEGWSNPYLLQTFSTGEPGTGVERSSVTEVKRGRKNIHKHTEKR